MTLLEEIQIQKEKVESLLASIEDLQEEKTLADKKSYLRHDYTRGKDPRYIEAKQAIGHLEELQVQLLKSEAAGKPCKEALPVLLDFLKQAEDDAYSYELELELLPCDYAKKVLDEDLINKEEAIELLTLALDISKGAECYWRAKPTAEILLSLLKEIDAPAATYTCLSIYYNLVLNVKKSAEVALMGDEACFKRGEIEKAAYLRSTALSCLSTLPDYKQPNFAEIKQRYGDCTVIVMRYKEGRTIQHDPVEATDEFQAVYDEVMEATQERKVAEGLFLPMSLWSVMEEEFAKRGIYWRSPFLMNPGVMFD